MAREIVRRFTKGDTLRSVHATLAAPDGTPIPLAGNTVTFAMLNRDTGEVKVDAKPAVIVDPDAAQVRYDWGTEDVDEPGEFWAWFIREEGGKTEHFPGTGRLFRIVIVQAESA